jgi:hypothetical protein
MDQHYLDQVSQEISNEQQQRSELRFHERQLKQRERNLLAEQEGIVDDRRMAGSMPAQMSQGKNAQSLHNHLKKLLPEHMVPGNVGGLNRVQWPFFHVFDFDFGDDPTLQKPNSEILASFQVTQEAALLLMALSWSPYSNTASGLKGPYNVEIRDRQSSRQFNEAPIPLQMFGRRSQPTILPTPMLIMPNAFLDATMRVWNTTPLTTVGSGKHQISVFGYRIRPKDAGKIMSLLFKGGN